MTRAALIASVPGDEASVAAAVARDPKQCVGFFMVSAAAGVFRAALAVVGPARILFGTDSSFFPRGWQRGVHEEQQAVLERLSVSAADRDQIFGGTFDRLFA